MNADGRGFFLKVDLVGAGLCNFVQGRLADVVVSDEERAGA